MPPSPDPTNPLVAIPGPRWLVNRAKALGRVLALELSLPGDLNRHDQCHVHVVHHAVFAVNNHNPAVYVAMQDLFDWHNIRSTTWPTEGYLRCLAIYGAAATAVLELEEGQTDAV